MATGKEKSGHLFAVLGVIQGLNTDPAIADSHEHVSQEKPPIEGPANAPERIKLESDGQARTVQGGAAKDPPPPQEIGPIEGSANFPQPELAAGGKPGPVSESSGYEMGTGNSGSYGQAAPYSVNLGQEYGNPPKDKAGTPSQTASYSGEANFGKADFNATAPPPPPPPPEEQQDQSKKL